MRILVVRAGMQGRKKKLVCYLVSCFLRENHSFFFTHPTSPTNFLSHSLTFQLFILLRAKVSGQAYPIRMPIDYVRSFILFYFFVWLLSENFVIFTVFFSFLKSPGSSRAVVFSLDRRDRLQFFVSSFPSHIPIFF
jgi:hypothetical protein